jgi:hypothetical protein
MPSTVVNFNASSVITDALVDLGVLEPGDALSASDGALGLRTLNRFISSLTTQALSFPFVSREVFPVVAGQSTYTIGPTGNLVTIRPQSLTGAGILFPSTGSPAGRLEVPRGLLTDDAYANLRLKDLTNALWTDVYYNPTYAAGLGSIFLWPTPNSTLYDLVLYRGDAIQGFANLTTFYDFPPGYSEMLQFNLEKRLCRVYGKAREWGTLDDDLAANSLRLVKRQNFKLTDAVLDQTIGNRRYGYSIIIGGNS